MAGSSSKPVGRRGNAAPGDVNVRLPQSSRRCAKRLRRSSPLPRAWTPSEALKKSKIDSGRHRGLQPNLKLAGIGVKPIPTGGTVITRNGTPDGVPERSNAIALNSESRLRKPLTLTGSADACDATTESRKPTA